MLILLGFLRSDFPNGSHDEHAEKGRFLTLVTLKVFRQENATPSQVACGSIGEPCGGMVVL